MTGRKVDYHALEQRFIVGPDDLSQRALAKEAGISNSTLSEYARGHDWEKKREAYRTRETERFIKESADEQARRMARIRDRGITVLEGLLVRVAQQLAGEPDQEGKQTAPPMVVDPRTALDAIKILQLLLGGPTERTEERSLVGIVADPKLIEALGELARRDLDPGTSPRAGLRALPGPEASAPRFVSAGGRQAG